MSSESSWPVCGHCGARIPQFAFPTTQDEARVRQLIREGRFLQAENELCQFTGCDPERSRLWVAHRGRPLPVVPGPPCPACGELLATSLARQCLACGADWHDQQPRP